MNVFARGLAVLVLGATAAACSSGPPTDQGPVTPAISQAELTETPPPATYTPIAVLYAKPIPGTGRADPFVALYGPATASSSKSVAVSTFPHIPTLPGFEGAPKIGTSIWDGVQVTGIVRDGGYTAIVTADGNSYIVHPGDYVANRFLVVAIDSDSVTLATDKQERHFSLGG